MNYMTYLTKIYKLLGEGDIRFKMDWIERTTYGLHETDGFNTTITVNVYDLILQCLIHECLHETNPKMTDKKDQVDKLSKKILKKMTQRQKAYLFRKFIKVVELPERRILNAIIKKMHRMQKGSGR